MKDIYTVKISKQAKKDLKKVPWYIALKLESWISAVGFYGLYEVRKVNGYSDELLKGNRSGQRSIRLNKAYRAIYVVNNDESISCVEIIEVNKHEY